MKQSNEMMTKQAVDEAFAQLTTRYGEGLMAFVGRIVTRQEDAEDVVQETLVKAYECRRQYDPARASLKTWLYRIAYHEALRTVRRQNVTFLEMGDELLENVPEELPDNVSVEQLDEAIRRLRPEDQMLLHLHYFDEHPLREVAYLLGAADTEREAGRLRTRLHRIRKQLYIILTRER